MDTEKLLKALKHRNPEIRHQVILVAGMVDEVAALPILREIHEAETDEQIKQNIVWAGKRLNTLKQDGYNTLDAIFEYFNINAEVMATHDPREVELLRQIKARFENDLSQQQSRASAGQIRNSFLTGMLMGGGVVGGLLMSRAAARGSATPAESRTEGRIERRFPAARPTDMQIDRWLERLMSDRDLAVRKKSANSLSDANNPAALPYLARVFRYDKEESMRDVAQRAGKNIYLNTVYWGMEQDGTLKAEMAMRREALGLPSFEDPEEKPKNDQPPAEDIAEILRKAEERKRKRG